MSVFTAITLGLKITFLLIVMCLLGWGFLGWPGILIGVLFSGLILWFFEIFKDFKPRS